MQYTLVAWYIAISLQAVCRRMVVWDDFPLSPSFPLTEKSMFPYIHLNPQSS